MNDMSGAELSEHTDGQLLYRFAKTGYQPAFSELIRRHGPMVLRMCRRVAGSDISLADDASQQVFLALASNAAALSTRITIAGWLYRTAWHVMTRLRRQRSIRAKHECQAAEFRAASASTQDGDAIPFAVVTSEFSEALGKALATLPEQYRDAIVLHHFAGHTVEETARILDVKTGTAASWLSRSRSMLRTRLDGFGAVASADVLVLWMNSHQGDERPYAIRAEDDVRRLSPFKDTASCSAVTASVSTSISSASGFAAIFPARWVAAAIIGLGVSGTTMAAAGGPAAAVESITRMLHSGPADSKRPPAKVAAAVEAPKQASKSFDSNRWSSTSTGGGMAIPEPATGALMLGFGFTLLAARRRR